MFEQVPHVWMERTHVERRLGRYRCPACDDRCTLSTDRPPKRFPCKRCAARWMVTHANHAILEAWREAYPDPSGLGAIWNRVTDLAHDLMTSTTPAYRPVELASRVAAVTAAEGDALPVALERLAAFVMRWREEIERGTPR